MLTRIISGLIGVIILFCAVLSGEIVLGIAISMMSLLALNEFYNVSLQKGYFPIKLPAYISFILLLALVFKNKVAIINVQFSNFFLLSVFIIIFIVFIQSIFLHNKYTLNDIAITTFSIMYIPFLFSFVILTRNLPNGFFYIWLIFIGSWMSDTFAYFTGVLLGKRKILPEISPKKTLEGSIGGVVGCVISMILYGYFMGGFHYLSPYHLAFIGVLCGIVSQVGDWGASSIKRYLGIKDFGNIMPGHGGVLDRFDSILFTAPVIYLYIKFLI